MKIKITNKVVEEKMDDNIILAVEKDGVLDISKTIILEAVAYDIWEYLKQNKEVSFKQLVNYLESIYDCDKETLIKDVEHFLQELKELEVVEFYEESRSE